MSSRNAGSGGMYGRASVPVPGQSPGHSPGQGQPAQPRMSGRAAVPTSPPAGGGVPPSPPGWDGGGRQGALVAPRRRPRWRRVLKWVSLSLLVLLVLGGGGLWLYLSGLNSNMDRVDAFSGIAAERPAAADGGQNILVLGSDSRDPEADPNSDAYRADTIMLMHLPSSGDGAYLISIPRDLWVYVPPNADGSAGGQEAKINAATAFGGVPLMVATVENYTGVRVDNVMMLDFAGFVEVTNALGGVDMRIGQTITSIHKPNRTFEEGTQHLNGEEALDYIRQRKQFAEGDFARMRNQQQFLRVLMDKAASTGTLTNPAKLNAFLQTVTSTLTVDEDFSLVGTGWQFRGLRSDDLTFVTSPHAGTGNIAGQSVVVSDDAAKDELYAAIRADRMAQWVADNPDRVGDG